MSNVREPLWLTIRRVVLPLLVVLLGVLLHVHRIEAAARAGVFGTPRPRGLLEDGFGFTSSLFSTPGWWCIGVGFLWFAAANIIHFQRLANARGKGRCPQCGQALPERPVA